jgi:hypothetical protein
MVGFECWFSSALDLDFSLDDWSEFDAGGNIVDVRLEMLWNVVSKSY